MQLVVQVNSQRENQSDPSQTEWQSLVPAKKKKKQKKQKVADPQKKSAASMRDLGWCYRTE